MPVGSGGIIRGLDVRRRFLRVRPRVSSPTIISFFPDLSSHGQDHMKDAFDSFEVSLLDSAGTDQNKTSSSVICATRTERDGALFRSVRNGVRYGIMLKGHRRGSRFYTPWTYDRVALNGNMSCTYTSERRTVSTSRSVNIDQDMFRLTVVRESEYTDSIDYLANHDSGDMLGDAAFLSVTAASEPNASIVNVSFMNSTVRARQLKRTSSDRCRHAHHQSPVRDAPKRQFTMYCVEMVPARLNFSTRNGNASFFADYVSCNYEHIQPETPSCVCQCWADRMIAGEIEGSDECRRRSNASATCSWDDMYDCVCPCSEEGTRASETFVGWFVPFFNSSRVPCRTYG